MALSDYTELQTSIADWLNRDDLTAIIPDFIRLAEGEFPGLLDHWRMDAKTSVTLDGQYVDLPADFEGAVRLALTSGDKRRLTLKSKDEIADLRGQSADTPAAPCFYAVVAGQLELLPTPDVSYTAELVYRQVIPALSVGSPTNWLLTERPGLYLYGALLQSAPYLKDDARLPVWENGYNKALAGLVAASEKTKFSGPLRISLPR